MASSRVCSIDTCKRSSRALCNCCQQNLCLDHLKEHSDLLNAQLTPLADEINQLFDQFNNIPLLEPTFVAELDAWRAEAHKVVDRFCDRKNREFEEIIHRERNKQKKELDRLRNQVNELIREQDGTHEHIDSINDSIRSLEEKINQFELAQSTFSPLIIDDRLIAIRNTSRSKDLLPLLPPYRTIKAFQVGCFSIAANDTHLLIFQDSKLCLLNTDMNFDQEILWTHDRIWNIFWSSRLAQFVVITKEEIFTLTEKTMALEQLILGGSEKMTDWFCGTCSNDNLLLSTRTKGSYLYQYTLQPSFELVKEFQSPISCTKDEQIIDLSSNNISLGLVICNLQGEVRLDLCSPTTLERYWLLPLGSVFMTYRVRCCSLSKNQWMVINTYSSELLHISADGKLIKRENHTPPPRHAVLFGKDVLALSTDKSFDVHRLS